MRHISTGREWPTVRFAIAEFTGLDPARFVDSDGVFDPSSAEFIVARCVAVEPDETEPVEGEDGED